MCKGQAIKITLNGKYKERRIIGMQKEMLSTVQMYCPNCGQKVVGYKGEDGGIRITCPRCRAVIFSKLHTKKELKMRVINPNT